MGNEKDRGQEREREREHESIYELVEEIDRRTRRIQENIELIKRRLFPPPATALKITWDKHPPHHKPKSNQRYTLFKENQHNMPVTLSPGQVLGFTVTPVDAGGNPSKATLSNLSLSSSDPAVFTVAPDPASPNTRGIATAGTPPTSPDAAVLTAQATATEPDGTTTEQVSGTDTVTVVTVPPPPPPASTLQITWDTPTPGGGA